MALVRIKQRNTVYFTRVAEFTILSVLMNIIIRLFNKISVTICIYQSLKQNYSSRMHKNNEIVVTKTQIWLKRNYAHLWAPIVLVNRMGFFFGQVNIRWWLCIGKLIFQPCEMLLLWKVLFFLFLSSSLGLVVGSSFSLPCWCQGMMAYRWVSSLSDPLGKKGKIHSQLKYFIISGLNIPRANLGTWQIYYFSGKM